MVKLYVCFWSVRCAHISFLSTFSHISRLETAHLRPEIITSKILVKNILLSENKSSRQKLPTPNIECLAGKTCHVCTQLERFFLTCTRLMQSTVSTKSLTKEKAGKRGIHPFTQVYLLSETWKRGWLGLIRALSTRFRIFWNGGFFLLFRNN